MKFIFLTCMVFTLSYCTDREAFSTRSIVESCFVDFTKTEELEVLIKRYEEAVDTKRPDPTLMVGLGCVKYQLGAVEESKVWLDKAFIEADSNSEVKKLAASVLSLIYIKTGEKDKATKLLNLARKHPMGRKMLVIYYIDYYRESNYLEYLKQAIDHEIQRKKIDESMNTPGSKLQLEMMQYVYNTEKKCNSSSSLSSLSAGSLEEEGVTTMKNAVNGSNTSVLVNECKEDHLKKEKDRLFVFVYGTLESILKQGYPYHL